MRRHLARFRSPRKRRWLRQSAVPPALPGQCAELGFRSPELLDLADDRRNLLGERHGYLGAVVPRKHAGQVEQITADTAVHLDRQGVTVVLELHRLATHAAQNRPGIVLRLLTTQFS